MKHKVLSLTLAATMLLLFSCEAPYLGEPSVEPDANITLRVSGFEQIPFDDGASFSTRAAEDITQLCSRLNFVVYSGEDKVKAVAQKRGDTDFGTVAFKLTEGTYTFAVIGHSSEGTATISSLDKITFKDNRVTDTFLYAGELVVTAEPTTHEVLLHRVVAMLRFVLTEDLPAEVRQMQFYYTGGSSTLSALSGYGSVNSRQTVKLDVAAGQRQFDVFTFPHTESDELKLTVTALDASGESLRERVFEHVPVTRNRITRYTGTFFGSLSGDVSDATFHFTANPEWDGEDEHTYD